MASVPCYSLAGELLTHFSALSPHETPCGSCHHLPLSSKHPWGSPSLPQHVPTSPTPRPCLSQRTPKDHSCEVSSIGFGFSDFSFNGVPSDRQFPWSLSRLVLHVDNRLGIALDSGGKAVSEMGRRQSLAHNSLGALSRQLSWLSFCLRRAHTNVPHSHMFLLRPFPPFVE